MRNNNMTVALVVLVSFILSAACLGQCGCRQKPPPPKDNKYVVSSKCPVCAKKIEDVSLCFDESDYKGKTYYFCSAEHKAKFDENPQKYLNKKSSKKEPAKTPKKKVAPKKKN
jgi:YHS domain-containing protein